MFNVPIPYWIHMSSDCNWTRTQNHLLLKRTLIGSGFESSCSHLNFRFRACFEQGVPWHSGNYRVWFHCETRTWHDKNILPNVKVWYIYKTAYKIQAKGKKKSKLTKLQIRVTPKIQNIKIAYQKKNIIGLTVRWHKHANNNTPTKKSFTKAPTSKEHLKKAHTTKECTIFISRDVLFF